MRFSPSRDGKMISFAKEQVNFNVIRISVGEMKFDVPLVATRMPAKVPGNWCNLIIAQPMALSDACVHIASKGWSATLIEHRESNFVLRFEVKAARLGTSPSKGVHRFWSRGRGAIVSQGIPTVYLFFAICEPLAWAMMQFQRNFRDLKLRNFQDKRLVSILDFLDSLTTKRNYSMSFFLMSTWLELDDKSRYIFKLKKLWPLYSL